MSQLTRQQLLHRFRQDKNLSRLDLAGLDLSHLDLAGANLRDATLTGAGLTAANLSNANLDGANLVAATLTQVNLTAANLRAADLTIANLVHAAPDSLTVELRSEDGRRLAYGRDLPRTADRPMARLTRQGHTIHREDTWPAPSDIGRPVILPGGEVGILQSWWNAEDGSQWRWTVEFYNQRET